jgi:hypothetical protein
MVKHQNPWAGDMAQRGALGSIGHHFKNANEEYTFGNNFYSQ